MNNLEIGYSFFEEYPKDRFNLIFIEERVKTFISFGIKVKLLKTEERYILLLSEDVRLD